MLTDVEFWAALDGAMMGAALALSVRWFILPGALEQDLRATLRWLERLETHAYTLATFVHRLLALVWAWTREPERRWERMRVAYDRGGYTDDSDYRDGAISRDDYPDNQTAGNADSFLSDAAEGEV